MQVATAAESAYTGCSMWAVVPVVAPLDTMFGEDEGGNENEEDEDEELAEMDEAMAGVDIGNGKGKLKDKGKGKMVPTPEEVSALSLLLALALRSYIHRIVKCIVDLKLVGLQR